MECTTTRGKLLENASSFHLFVYDMIDSKLFGAAILFIILFNTVILILQTDERLSVETGNLQLLNSVFVLHYYFALESDAENVHAL